MPAFSLSVAFGGENQCGDPASQEVSNLRTKKRGFESLWNGCSVRWLPALPGDRSWPAAQI